MIQRYKFETRQKSKRLLILMLVPYIFFAPLEVYLNTGNASILKYYTIFYILLLLSDIILKKSTLLVSRSVIPLLLFTISLCLSIFWSLNIDKGLYYIGALGLQVLLIFVVFQFEINTSELRILAQAFAGSSMILATLVLINNEQVGDYAQRYSLVVGDTVIDPNNIAAMLACGFAFLLFYNNRNRFWVLVKPLFLIIIPIAILLTSSRGATLAVLCVVSYSVYIRKSTGKAIKIMLSLIVLFFIVFVIDKYLNLRLLDGLSERFNDKNGGNRVDIWINILPYIVERPFWGYGIGSSSTIVYYITGVNIGAHNTFLTILTELGLFGFVPFVMIITNCLKRNCIDEIDYGIKAILIAALVCSFFFDTYNKKVLWLPIVLNYISMRRKSVV